MVNVEGIAVEKAIQVVTSNVARVLKLANKGCVSSGLDADFTVVDTNFVLQDVWAQGCQMVQNGKPLVWEPLKLLAF